MRDQFGPAKNLSTIRSIDASAASTRSDLGISRSVSEHADLPRRSRGYALVDALNDQLMASSDNFAGLWIDQKNDGLLNIAFTSAPSRAASKYIIGKLPPNTPYRVVIVSRSMNDLLALRDKIDADTKNWGAHGIVIESVGPDVAHNQVVVSALKAPADEIAALEAQYGPGVTVARVSAGSSGASSSSSADASPQLH